MRSATIAEAERNLAEVLKSAMSEPVRILDESGDLAEFLVTYREAAKLVPIVSTIRACRDEDDNKFLDLAVDGRADLIVTGDDDLLALHPFRGIRILTPQQFLAFADRLR
jgi:putative PIN family toxin of toxin-antitoxin system